MRLKKSNFIARLFKKGRPEAKTYDARDFELLREGFHHHAMQVVKVLQEAGFEAYIVGGGVRDQLLDLHPKDFDVATNARPEQVKKCFSRAIIIGRRFRLVHVFFSRYDFVEVATFRKEQAFLAKKLKTNLQKNGIVARDNAYGTLEEDAFRRDFTVNALYYDPLHQKIIDFNNGMTDLKHKVLRLIGKPTVRLQEDPVRILRALRISNKIGFAIDDATTQAIPKFIPLLKEIAGGRLFDEYQKLFLHGDSVRNFASLKQFGILPYLFPTLPQALKEERSVKMIQAALENTDARCQAGKTINPAFLIAVFLWHPLHVRMVSLQKKGSKREAYAKAVREILKEQTLVTNMPGHLVEFIEQTWMLQRALERRSIPKALHIVTHPRYRAAFDFLLLRSQVGEVKQDICDWWHKLYQMKSEDRAAFLGLPGKVDGNDTAQ